MTWNDWGRLTRFLESARIAFAREHTLWDSLDLAEPGTAKIQNTEGMRKYTVTLAEHRDAVSDTWILHASVLVYFYALAEAAAADKLGCEQVSGGIEDWSKLLLAQANSDWSKVSGGKAGLVEVAVVRNIIAHGGRQYTASNVNRLRDAGVSPVPGVGEIVKLDYETLLDYRSRLKSLLRNAQVRDAHVSSEDETGKP